MTEGIIYSYLLVFLLPSIALISLAVYIYIRYSYKSEGKLLFFMTFIFGCLFLLEFIRHLAPITHSAFYIQYFLSPLSIIAFCIALHLVSTSVFQSSEETRISPFLYYLPLVVHFIFAYLYPLETTTFYKYSIWIQHDSTKYDNLFYLVILAILVSSIVLLYWKKRASMSLTRNKLISFMARTYIVLTLFFLTMITVFNHKYFPPIPALLLGLCISILFVIGFKNYNLSPSITDRYKIIFDLSPIALLILNENKEIVEMNKRAKDFFTSAKGNTLDALFNTSFNQQVANKLFNDLKQKRSINDQIIKFEDPLTMKLETYSVNGSVIRLGDVQKYYLMWRNITEEIEREQLIEQLAYYDGLTNIYNRTYFVPNASKIIQNYVMSDDIAAIILLDLNYFKFINDTYGHSIGDLVLIKTANILKEAIPMHKPVIARLGGDEFVMLVQNLPNRDYIHVIIQQLRQQFIRNPFESHKIFITISPSIGHALIPFESIHLEELLQIADKRMYEDKTRIKSEND